MRKGFKALIITIAAVIVLGVVFAGVAFAADSNNAQVPGCCSNQSACNGYCSTNGVICQPGNCVAICPGTCNSNNAGTLSGSCCTSNGVQQNAVRTGGCCGGLR